MGRLEINSTRRRFGLSDPGYRVLDAVNDYISFSERTKRPKTIELIKYSMKVLTPFQFAPMCDVQPSDFQKIRQGLLESHSINGSNMILGQISACFQFARVHGHIDRNPAAGLLLKPVKVAKFLTKAEVGRLLGACSFNKELASIVHIALHTGMRQGEILRIRPEHPRNGYIYISESKTDEPGKVPIHASISKDLARINFAKWSKNRLTRAYRRAVLRAGLDVRFHDLRHTFCSRYLEEGGTLADLREITRHKTLKMLQTYSHFQTGFLQDRINAVSFT